MLAFLVLSLISLSSAFRPVPLLGYSSTSFPLLDELRTNDQASALNTLFDHDKICGFEAIIVATQEALHATHLRSTYSTIVDQYRSAESSVHLPYLTYSVPPIEWARDLATRCNAKLLRVSTDATAAVDVSQKHVVYLEFPSVEEVDEEMVARQIATFERAFPLHLTLFTGIPLRASKRQSTDEGTHSAPALEPTPTAPLAPVSYRVLTPTLVFSFGVVFGLVVPLVYIAIGALSGIKSPAIGSSFKGPSADKKNR